MTDAEREAQIREDIKKALNVVLPSEHYAVPADVHFLLRLLDEARAEIALLTAPGGASALKRAGELCLCLGYLDEAQQELVLHTIEQARREARTAEKESIALHVERVHLLPGVAAAIRALAPAPQEKLEMTHDDLIARLKRRAARHGRSTEAEHREILRQVLAGEHEPSFEKLAADLRKLTKRRKQTPSEILLREGRDER